MLRLSPRARCSVLLLLPLALAVVVGCVTPRKPAPVETGGPRKWMPADQPDTPPAPAPVVRASTELPPGPDQPRKPRTILALSGGGSYGAYTAGILNGWTQTGHRPEFDVVTGISTGALIAPMAFVGAEYDGHMELIYTRVTRRDIFTYRNWATIPFRDAIATTAPLRQIVEAGMSESIIRQVAEEHRKGRRLYVGTTNLDSRRFVTWDLGAIALKGASGDRAEMKKARTLFIDLLIASCSLPGIFPPVPIQVEVDGKAYTELHIDGGATAVVFVPPSVMDAAALDPGKPLGAEKPADLYIILAGKQFADPGPVESRLFDVLTAFTGLAQAAMHRRDTSNLYHMSKVAGINFHMTAVSNDMPAPGNGLAFDREEMGKLYEQGVRIGRSGPLWWAGPPERGPGEVDPIRTGVKFVTPR